MSKGTKRAKPAEVWGPRVASWSIQRVGSTGSTQVGSLDRARSTLAYFRRQEISHAGDGVRSDFEIVRTETCPSYGCSGEHVRSIPRRGKIAGGWHREVPCVGCLGTADVPEDLAALEPVDCDPKCRSSGWPIETLDETLARFGLEACTVAWGSDGYTRCSVRHVGSCWEIFRGTPRAVRDWLREIGLVL